jgi:cation-transporting ATPase 13A1
MIAEATLHDPLPFFLRPCIWPFTFLYPVFSYFYFEKYDEYINGSEWTFVYLGTIITLQGLLWIMPFWNVEINRAFTTQKVRKLNEITCNMKDIFANMVFVLG